LKEVPDKIRFRLVVNDSNWPLLAGGRYSQVVVKTGLTVLSKNILILPVCDGQLCLHIS
jgi:hypothetical protein